MSAILKRRVPFSEDMIMSMENVSEQRDICFDELFYLCLLPATMKENPKEIADRKQKNLMERVLDELIELRDSFNLTWDDE